MEESILWECMGAFVLHRTPRPKRRTHPWRFMKQASSLTELRLGIALFPLALPLRTFPSPISVGPTLLFFFSLSLSHSIYSVSLFLRTWSMRLSRVLSDSHIEQRRGDMRLSLNEENVGGAASGEGLKVDGTAVVRLRK